MEIERKFLVDPADLPDDLSSYRCRIIEQGYLNAEPVIRIRRDDADYVLTYKSKGFLSRQEYNLPLNQEAYDHLLPKIDGRLIKKKRYMLPLPDDLFIELDLFEGELKGLILAEVEFPSTETANAFAAPDWFGEEVTDSDRYQNVYLSKCPIN